MSEENVNQTEEAQRAQNVDASFKIDASSLSTDENDFARQMGFGDDGNDGASNQAQAAAAVAPARSEPELPIATEAAAPDLPSADTAVDEDEEPPDEEIPEDAGDAAGDDNPAEEGQATLDDDPAEESDRTVEMPAMAETPDNEPEADAPDSVDDTPSDAPGADWEEIHPRPASEGIQATLESRADDLLSRESRPSAASSVPAAAAPQDTATGVEFQAVERKVLALQNQLHAREAELDSLRASLSEEIDSQAREEKEQDELRAELDTLSLDRDQLIDQLALTSGQLVQSEARAEKFEASLRAARGALTPLPEGERALRAEVIGLRGRLEEAREESQGLANQLASSATELAVARARVEDRQHEVNSHLDRVTELEAQLTQNDKELKTTLARHREMIAMTTRLQADNNELRSAQAALEETLEARDLEIVAREEHLNVTRQGLAARDLQLVDLNERLDQEHRRSESLSAEHQRSQIAHDQLIEKIAHRESRIATLTQTLARIEEAMGHPMPGPDSAAREMPQAEWSHPTLPGKAPSPKVTRSNLIEPEVASIETNESEEPNESEAPSASVLVDEPTEPDKTGSPEAITPVSQESELEEIIPFVPVLTAPPALPSILTTWRDRRFGELIGEPENTTVHAFLAKRLQKHLGLPGPQYVYLKSLGGSLPDSEVRLVSSLRDLGVGEIRMEVLDSDPSQADARRHKIELAGLGEIIEVTVGDLDQWDAEAPCHAILLSDALHSQPKAGAFLDHVAPTLTSGALVLFLDRIASGPLQLSASALIRLEELWELLPETLTNAEGLSIVPHRGDDGGFPSAQCDPTREILERLEPIVIAGFGHLADLVVGPSRGKAMSTENETTMQLLESIMAMDLSRSHTESLTPRHGLGVFAHGSAGRTEILGHDWPSEPKPKDSES